MFRGNDNDNFIWLALESHTNNFEDINRIILPDIEEDYLNPKPIPEE